MNQCSYRARVKTKVQKAEEMSRQSLWVSMYICSSKKRYVRTYRVCLVLSAERQVLHIGSDILLLLLFVIFVFVTVVFLILILLFLILIIRILVSTLRTELRWTQDTTESV